MINKNKILIITGMHRSGTSLVSRWLYNCGLNLGDNLIGSAIGNVLGHFEDLDFVNLHEKILKANNMSPNHLKKNIIKINLNIDQKKELEKLTCKKNKANKIWGWKDPRTCLFLKDYETILNDSAFYLVIYRDFDSVVNSLMNRALKQRNFSYEKKHVIQKWIKKSHFFGNKNFYSEISPDLINIFSKAWIHYNYEILNHISSIDSSRYRIVNYSILQNKSDLILDWLNLNEFSLDKIDCNDYIQENLISNSKNKINISDDLREEVIDINNKYSSLLSNQNL